MLEQFDKTWWNVDSLWRQLPSDFRHALEEIALRIPETLNEVASYLRSSSADLSFAHRKMSDDDKDKAIIILRVARKRMWHLEDLLRSVIRSETDRRQLFSLSRLYNRQMIIPGSDLGKAKVIFDDLRTSWEGLHKINWATSGIM